MKTKFVNSKTTADYADELHSVEKQIARMQAQLAGLIETRDQLTSHLLKTNNNKTFEYNSGKFLKRFTVSNRSRMIIDQDRVRKLLKSKTPYKEVRWVQTSVDFVYES